MQWKVKCFIRLFAILLLCSSSAGRAAERYSLVRIAWDSPEQLDHLLQKGLDITLYDGRSHTLETIVSDEAQLDLLKAGFKPKPVIADFTAYTEGTLNEQYFRHFHNYEQMLTEMQELVALAPDRVALVDIGDSYSKVNGADSCDIWALKISDEVSLDDPVEAEALFMANIHAREIITPEIILYFARLLTERYGMDPYITHLVDEREMWLVPFINPDGHEYVFSGDIEAVMRHLDYDDPVWWRRNVNDFNANSMIDSYDGVDLNRNFGYKWGYDNTGSSPSHGSDIYRGPYAFSEPESQVIRDFVEQHSFVTSLSFHSYGRYWLYPWSYERLNPSQPDLGSFIALADSCVAYNGYEAGNYYTGTIYQVNGDTDDWLYGEKHIFAFTPEVGSTDQGRFWPDTTQIENLILENIGPCLYMAYAAGEEPLVSLDPLPDCESALSGYTLTAKISQPVLLTEFVPLEPSQFRIFYNTTGTAPFLTAPLNAASGMDTYTGVIPGGQNGVTMYYYVQAADAAGRTGTCPRGAPAAVYSFKVGVDTEAPVIDHQPVDFQPPSEKNVRISATVQDNIQVQAVWVEIQKNQDPLISLSMTSPGQDSSYSVSLDQLNLAAGDSLFYRILAEDASALSNRTVVPEQGWYFFGIYQSLALYDFETDFICRTGAQSDWQWGAPVFGPDSAHSGGNLWGTVLDGTYSNSSDSRLDLPELLLDTTCKKMVFRFWHWYQTEYSDGTIWDGGNVKVSVDGAPYVVIEPSGDYDGVINSYNPALGNEPGYGGPSRGASAWQPAMIDLSDYIGHAVQLRFHFGSDDNTPLAGWYVDDMEWLVYPALQTGLDRYNRGVPAAFTLAQNYPNPFNSQTRIEFEVPRISAVRIALYNAVGQLVQVMADRTFSGGRYTLIWDGTGLDGQVLPSGIYVCQLSSGPVKLCRKMIVVK